MTERERLYELIVDADNEFFRETPYGTAQERIEKTVEHLLANGVLLPPCKIGDKLYVAYESKVTGPWVCDFPEIVKKIGVGVENLLGGFKVYTPDDFGNTVFLTREDAEAAIRKRKEVRNE